MSDLFHEAVPDKFIADVFAVMRVAHRHTFQILTKRAPRMTKICSSMYAFSNGAPYLAGLHGPTPIPPASKLVLPNVWLGVSVENQETAEERIPLLLQTPAAVRFLSVEPLLERVDLSKWIDRCSYYCDHGDDGYGHRPENSQIDWVIVGAESGPRARPMNEDWVRSIRDRCQTAGVAFFYKQRAVNGKKIATPELDGFIAIQSRQLFRICRDCSSQS